MLVEVAVVVDWYAARDEVVVDVVVVVVVELDTTEACLLPTTKFTPPSYTRLPVAYFR